MAKRAASLVQADFDRAVAAFCKCGIVPAIVFDVERGTVTVKPLDEDAKPQSDWREGAQQRV